MARFHDFDPSTTCIRHQGDGFRLFDFRCPPGHPRWTRLDHAPAHVLVFPRTAVRLDVPALGPAVVDATGAILMPGGQSYRRDCLSPAGDLSDGLELSDDFLDGVADSAGLRRERRRGWDFGFVPIPGPLWKLHRESRRIDAVADLDELVLELVAGVIESKANAARGERRKPPLTPLQRRRIDCLRAELGRRRDEPWPLTAMAAAVGLAPARLCRVFRAATGTTIHAYREALRLRVAFERLERDERDITGLALDLGYSSHAHFTSRFRRHFGRPPSSVRSAFRPPALA